MAKATYKSLTKRQFKPSQDYKYSDSEIELAAISLLNAMRVKRDPKMMMQVMKKLKEDEQNMTIRNLADLEMKSDGLKNSEQKKLQRTINAIEKELQKLKKKA